MNVLPAKLSRQLDSQLKRTNEEVIISYLTSAKGAVVLTDEQEDLLQRWDAADDWLRSNKYTRKQVANMLAKRFDTSIATGYRDIESAMQVYGSTRKSNKGYLFALHVERIESMVQIIQQSGRLELIPKIMDSYTNALKNLPEDKTSNKVPSAIILNIGTVEAQALNILNISPADAERIAAERGAIEDLDEDEYEVE